MKTARYRGWRFLHPDLDAPEAFAGLSLAPNGRLQMVEEDAAVRQSILLLLSTVPGERVMRPNYGCDLHRLLFSPNDDTTAGLAIHYVRQALRLWEPRIVILKLDARRDDGDPGRLLLRLHYRLKGRLESEELSLGVNLDGE